MLLLHAVDAVALAADYSHMTSLWQHIMSMRIMIKWCVRHTLLLMCRTDPRLCNCQDYAKLACHCTARSKMEWIYTQTKKKGQGILELALEMKKKEREIDKWLFF